MDQLSIVVRYMVKDVLSMGHKSEEIVGPFLKVLDKSNLGVTNCIGDNHIMILLKWVECSWVLRLVLRN